MAGAATLHQRVNEGSGLHGLACAVDDDAWDRAVRDLEINPDYQEHALHHLLQLLHEHVAQAIAQLAGPVL